MGKPRSKPKTKIGEVEKLRNQIARTLADYDNLRKRFETEREAWVKFSTERVLTELLPVLDNFEAAQAHLNDQGLAIAIAEFKKVFIEEGLTEIKPEKGAVFDAHVHEAVESADGGKSGHIAGLLLSGWKYEDGRVIRFAKVKVFTDEVKGQK